MGEPYISYDSTKKGLYGKSRKIDPSVTGGYSEFTIEQMDRGKIRNCVMFGDNITQDTAKSYCMLCKAKCIPMTKQQLVDMYSNTNFLMVERVNEKCIDGQVYSWCKECGQFADRPDTEIVAVSMAAHLCVKCMHTPENMGRIRTLKPENMLQDKSDPNSTKRWFWHCSLCDYRYPVEGSNLIRQYVNTEAKSFVKSIETRKKTSSIPQEDRDDMSGLGTITSGSGTDIPPPGY